MKYQLKVVYPVEEINQTNSTNQVSTKKVLENSQIESADLIELYKKLNQADYDLKVKYSTKEAADEIDPFKLATNLNQQGIDYKATLKLKLQDSYDKVKPIVKEIEAMGFDLTIAANFKINGDSKVNFDHSETWLSEDGKNSLYKVSPKASSDNIMELKSLYEALKAHSLDVTIDLKPSLKSVDDKVQAFAHQLALYPENTLVTINLKNK